MADKVDTPLTPNTDDKITYDKTVAYQEIVLFEYKTKMIIMNTVICVLLANRSPIGMFCLGIGGTSLVCFLYFCFPMGKKIGLDTLNRELHYKSVLLIPLCKCYDQKYQIQKISHLPNIINK